MFGFGQKKQLKEKIGKAVVAAFEQLGGDPSTAVQESKGYGSVEWWIRANQSKVGIGGAVAMSAPGAHIAFLTADVLYLLRIMARVGWGIGGIQNRLVHGEHDLEHILALWTGAATREEVEASVQGFAEAKGELYKEGIEYIDDELADLISRIINLHSANHPIDYIINEIENSVPGHLSLKFGKKNGFQAVGQGMWQAGFQGGNQN